MNHNQLLIKKNFTIKKAIAQMIKVSSKTLIVVDSNNLLMGTISDGDIRKFILKKPTLYLTTKINEIYNNEPIFFNDTEFDNQKIISTFTKYKIDVIPIINKNKKIVKVIRWYELFDFQKNYFKKIKIPGVIVAGGKGERLMPLTEILPKALMPVEGEPIIAKTINMFIRYKINNIFVMLNHKSDLIKNYLKKFDSINKLKFHFINESKPLGTAGGLYKLKKINFDDFIIINCDVIINYDISKIVDYHKKHKSDLTICVANKRDRIQYGICEIDDRNNLTDLIEKPVSEININSGLYIMNKSLIDIIEKNKTLNMDKLILKAKSQKMKIKIYKIDFSNWHEIGMIKDYLNYIK